MFVVGSHKVLTGNGPACRLVAHPQMGSPIAAVKHGVQVGPFGSETKVVVGFEDNAIRQGEVRAAKGLAGCGCDVHEEDA